MEPTELAALWSAVQQEPDEPAALEALAAHLERSESPEPGLGMVLDLSLPRARGNWQALQRRYAPVVEHLIELVVESAKGLAHERFPGSGLAFEKLEQARELAWRFHLPVREIHCLLEGALLLQRSEQPTRAMVYCRRVLLLCGALEAGYSRSLLEGRTYTQMAALQQPIHLEQAMASLRLAIRAFIEAESAHSAVGTWDQLAQLHEENGDLQAAIYARAQAIALLELTNREAELLQQLLRQANLLIEISATNKAESLCAQGIRLAERLGEDSELGLGYLLLGNISYQGRQWTGAEAQYLQACECFRRAQAVGLLRHALLSLFEARRQQQNWAAAQQSLFEAIRLGYRSGERVEQVDVAMASVLWTEVQTGGGTVEVDRVRSALAALAEELSSGELFEILTSG
ncbi:hypothetical protein [Gloeobacter morelensis]|uniref:MalT-like TPR region domain-containing protein n=1 Tax=Gloeobacter morelensis MG652769 TaxID=2781736 RepID=A0ABY3PQJ3_9CYAN|nr:hypothetical protein [Gloeobacter morelensis]UFP95966.1 hypothetical protein ISF26_07035 [Gloeobacter morelensis MG652769]